MKSFDELVNLKDRTVDPSVFWDPELYRLEQERIFARYWQVVGLEAEIPKPNDYISSWIGEESVFVTRDAKGEIHVLLNSCPHRGAKVCRAEKGAAKTFTCPYHGWTFRNTGELIGVPLLDENYFGALDKKKWGLLSARVEVVYGLIFACFDPEAPSLDEFLGDMKWCLQLMLDRTPEGMEVLQRSEKILIDANWKLQSDQFCGDNYHAAPLHRAVMMLFPNANFNDNADGRNFCASFPHGHSFFRVASVTTENPDHPEIAGWIDQLTETRKKRLSPAQASLVTQGTSAIFNIFPNLSVQCNPEFVQIRLNLPRGPSHQLLVYYLLVDREAPSTFKEAAVETLGLLFSGSGIFELEDGTVWAEATNSLKGPIRQRQPLNYSMGMGHEKADPDIPGMVTYNPPTEDNVFNFYRGWREALEYGPGGKRQPHAIAAE